ncbi:hypothetical protein [Bradyrhizobium sp. B117]|uniref:hypothetical protein n=1 Tax=Bradyrhizobium sp. B117 TaxID=3140246 RepID=UPI003182F03C
MTADRSLASDQSWSAAPVSHLETAVGAWFNLQEASDFSDKRKSEIEAARRAGKLPMKMTMRKRSTIEDLLDDWSKSVEFKALTSA